MGKSGKGGRWAESGCERYMESLGVVHGGEEREYVRGDVRYAIWYTLKSDRVVCLSGISNVPLTSDIS